MDGTTLYISRDVAGALDRYERFKFDKMYYVVDTTQRGHFVALIRILERLEAECAPKVEYVPFGRVNGMSTRKGEAVWLDDILKQAKHKMQQKQIESLSKNFLLHFVAKVLSKRVKNVNDRDFLRFSRSYSGFFFQIYFSARKAPIEGETANILGQSSIIISDLKLNRMRHYDFSWESAIQVFLMYIMNFSLMTVVSSVAKQRVMREKGNSGHSFTIT